MVSVNKTATIAVHTSYKENADLTKIKAIWFNGGKIQNPELENISDELKHLLDDNYSTVLEGFLKFANVFKIGRSINPFECSKMDVLLLAQEVGFLIPDTLFTENKSDLNNFYQKYSKKGIISKRISDQTHFYENNQVYNLVNTFEVNSELLSEIPNTFGLSQFQERIERQYEIRVVYLLGKCYAMAVFTSDIVDYRINLNKHNQIRMIPFILGAADEHKLSLLMNKLNLNYGSIDFIVDHNDTRYLLEINPCGQVGFVNEACNYYLEKEISKLLLNAVSA
jgi:glutathione synthase/RimK-type ligase-like ATP-grasp enzyme